MESAGKQYKERRCAAGVKREQSAICSEFGLGLDKFIDIGIEAMQGIAEELGL